YQWQNSTDGTTFADISGATGLNYTPAALSATTYYQLVQTSASTCGVETTNMVTITVYPDFVAGSISADQSICYNTTPAEIVGVAPTGGNTPYTYQWQNSTDGTTFADISGATGLNYSPAALSATTYYQLVQTSASTCGVVTTNLVTITVYPDFVVGSISADQSICYNTAPAEIVGVAPTGGNTPYTYQWQNSTDGTTFADISGATGLNYTPAALSATTYYQLVQTSASTCGVETTNMVTITVYPDFVAGSISADQSICYNTTPAEIVGVAPTGGNTPYTYQWQNSTDGTTFADISGATGLNYSPAALSATTYYQLVQTSASSCGVETTNMVTITVYPDFVVGSISADQTICFNTAPAELTGVAPTGGNTPYIYQWQNSTDGTTFADISGATGLNYSPAALSATTYYQLVQTSASTCGVETTNMVTITVYPDFVAGSISADQSICYNTTPAEIVGVAPTGGNTPYTYQWQNSTDGTTFADISGATGLNYSPAALSATTYYQLVQTSASSCGVETTNMVTITVYPDFVVGSISADQTICYNTAPAELTGVAPPGGNTPYTYQWQNSTDGTTFADISGATSLNYTPAALSATTYYQLVQTSASGCGYATTNMVTITVYPDFVVGSISADQTICFNTAPAELTGVAPTGGNTPYIYQWQNSTDGTTFADISGATGLNYSPAALSATTYYQLVQTSASSCGVETTNMVTITVYPDFVVGSISADQTICYNTAPAELTGVAPTGGNTPYTYQWQNSTDGTTFADITGATSLNYQPGALFVTTYYQLIQTSASGCGTLTTNMVTITGDIIPPIITSSPTDQSVDANENCEAILADYTGDVVATDNCDTDLTIAQSPIAGTIISGTANTVTMTVTDDAGNFAEVSFNVEVVDNTDPTITSPGTQIIHATADCDAVLPDYTGDVVVSDNCDTDPTVTQSPVAGTIISGATNPVTLTVADYAGNSAQVTFNVKVLDITPPDVTSPHPHQFVDADESCQAVLADYTGDVVATDNCSSVITIVQSPAPGTIISGPTNEVQIFVSDETGNTAIIQFNVAVVDNTDPTIVCVEDQNVGADETNTYTVAGTLFDPISTDDNCEVATVENDYNNSATLDGAIFPLGTTTVTWTVEDNSGNTADCSFDVTVYTTVGLESLDENSVSIYPNPTTGKVYFEFTSSKDRQLKISDFTGRPIFETNIIGNNGIVDLSTYARGVYIITILEDNSTFTTRILKR
ncbi:MAG: HYR domain-containing protein, partial [Bacteroidetes bacterium]|nr:HYR domain-containing protein [Bacteroidota bacterium]